MKPATFDTALEFTLRHEGGLSEHPADHGGLTNRGITQRTYNRFRAARGLELRSVELLEQAELWTIYLREYWQAGHCDELPPRIACAHFDATVHSGPTQAALFLQRAAWARDDGDIGPETIAAANSWDERLVVFAMLANRQAFLRMLASRGDQGVFLRGNLRRVRDLWTELYGEELSPPAGVTIPIASA